ncbi:Hypothetical predicted protein [Mytilus galloprovincialis]|uniref:Uncharacterized protein n=1 Tax=Mytilus galloprovincialis TaxID=29158 RepID=A0A8B6DJT8_MYTGA|nr:Hypothetical predicted protein [Mytilus galloprovincialis]
MGEFLLLDEHVRVQEKSVKIFAKNMVYHTTVLTLFTFTTGPLGNTLQHIAMC